MQQKQWGDWDLNSLAAMALSPSISKEAVVSMWELGWQETLEEDSDTIPMAATEYEYMDPWKGLKL
eukprot:2843441-Rhodomonas_salina.1